MNTSVSYRRHIIGKIELGHIVVLAVLVFIFLYFFGCGDGVVSPNVRVSYRSAIGPGYVLIIANAGSKPLFKVTVTCDDWSKRYIVSSQLDVGSSIEAGWLELPEGCKRGKTYKISAEGYAGSKHVTIP